MPGFDGPLLPALLQEMSAEAKQINNAHDANRNAILRRSLFANIAANASNKTKQSQAASIGKPGYLSGKTGKISDGAVVVIVKVEVAEPEPGVAVEGEKEHDASEGKPEHASETGSVKAPNCCATVIV